jgi:hypothetical protein
MVCHHKIGMCLLLLRPFHFFLFQNISQQLQCSLARLLRRNNSIECAAFLLTRFEFLTVALHIANGLYRSCQYGWNARRIQLPLANDQGEWSTIGVVINRGCGHRFVQRCEVTRLPRLAYTPIRCL